MIPQHGKFHKQKEFPGRSAWDFGGRNRTRTCGLAALRLLRSTSQWSPRDAAACDAPLLSTPPPRCIPHCGRSAPAPHRCERCALPYWPIYIDRLAEHSPITTSNKPQLELYHISLPLSNPVSGPVRGSREMCVRRTVTVTHGYS